ncbi:MAG TPA: hypothetical protein VM734_00070 [Kofleriaceae bacterium]|nr:hypothetical protein [Kofleriaceae bacterium]
MRTTPCLFVAALAGAVLVGCNDDDDIDFGTTMVLQNRSSFALEEVRLARIDDPEFGPDLLPDVLLPGEDLIINNIDCGVFDVLIVDELGVPCTLTDLELCVSSDVFVIDDTLLDICAFSPRESP